MYLCMCLCKLCVLFVCIFHPYTPIYIYVYILPTYIPIAEEVAGFYAIMIKTDYVLNPVFNKNFFKDWYDIMYLYVLSIYYVCIGCTYCICYIPIHTHTHTYSSIYTPIHTHIHIPKHAPVYTYTHTHTPIHTHIHIIGAFA